MTDVAVVAPGTATARQRRILIAILGVAGALRLAWGLYALRAVPVTWVTSGDQYSYWYYADQMARGHGYISYTVHRATSYYPVGYPALLAALFFVLRHTPLPDAQAPATAVLHAAMSTATVAFVYLVARRVAGVPAGLVAAGVAAVFPNLIFEVGTFSLETAFVFFAMAALALACSAFGPEPQRFARDPGSPGPPIARKIQGGGRRLSVPRVAAFGLVLGLSALVRPFSLPFLAGFVVAALLAGVGWRGTLAGTAIVVGVVVVVLAPWTVRNAVRLHAFVPFSTNLGDTLCLDRSLRSNGAFSWADHEGCADPALGEVERNAENTRLALRFVTSHPTAELRLVGDRLTKMMSHDHSGLEEAESGGRGRFLSRDSRHLLSTAADVWFVLVLVLSVPGLVVLVRGWRARPERAVVTVALAALFVIPLELWGNPRFHVPMLPLLAVTAGAGVELLVRQAPAPWKAASPKVKMPPSAATIQ